MTATPTKVQVEELAMELFLIYSRYHAVEGYFHNEARRLIESGWQKTATS